MIGSLTHLLAGAALLARAAMAPDTSSAPVRTMPAIEVARERLDARRRLPTASVTELRAGRSSRAFETLSDLLPEAASAHLVQTGGIGSRTTLSLRGVPAGQVSVYLDGVPLTSAAHSAVDLSLVPDAALEHVEVYRGLAPAGFGAAAPGGAVNLVTADDARARTLHLASGSFGTWEGRGTFAGAHGPWSALVHAGGLSTRGDYHYLDDNGTPFEPADDHDTARINDRVDQASALARVGWSPHAGLRMRASVTAQHDGRGVPGRGAVPAPNPRATFARGLGAFDAARSPGERTPGASWRAYLLRERTTFRDPESQLGLGQQDTRQRFGDLGTQIELVTPRGWTLVTASAGGALRHERGEGAPPTSGQPVPPVSTRRERSAWVTAQLHLFDDALLVHAARRWDRQRDALRATLTGGVPYAADFALTLNAPQAGARLRLPRGLEARANWTRTGRAPEFVELFGNQGDVLGNPKLVPERAEGWDAGLAWRGRWHGLEAALDGAHFATHERDGIAFWPASQRVSRAVNVARAELRGEEGALHLDWRGLSLAASTAWLSALQTQQPSIYFGRRLPQRPDRQTYVRLEARHGRWSASADALWLGAAYLDPINFTRLPPRTLTGASLAVTAGVVRVSVEGKNLGDARAQDFTGYPIPGRSFFLALDWSAGEGAARP